MSIEELDIRGLVEDMRVVIAKVKQSESLGQLTPALEVGPRSFVQILQAVRLTEKPEPVTWKYLQAWVESMSQADRELLIGSFVGECIGKNKENKIIAIYDQNDTVRRY